MSGNDQATHDLTLTNGSTSIKLLICDGQGVRNPLAFSPQPINKNTLKTFTGVQRYADLSGYWDYTAQTDWSGCRGSKDFERNESMYYDADRINTMRGNEIILGPKATTVSFGSYVEMKNGYASSGIDFEMLSVRDYYWAFPITASKDIAVKDITIDISLQGGAGGSLSVGFGTVSGGNPAGATYSANTVSTATYSTSGQIPYKFTFTSAYNMTSGTAYFLLVKVTGLTGIGYFTSRNSTTTGVTVKTSADGATWANAVYPTQNPYFITTNGGSAKNKAHLFEYKGALYYAMQNNDATGTKLYMDGDHGLAKTGASTTAVTIKSAVTWAAHEAIGSILVIVSGTGASQPQNWRVITGNTVTGSSETALTFSDPWDVAPAENDVLAIVASDKFTEIAGFDSAYSVVVTDVLSVNGAMYFACGDTEVIKRVVAFSDSGTWTYHYSGVTAGQDAETGAYTHLAYASDETGSYVWGAKGGYPSQIAKAPAQDYSAYTGTEALLVFGTAILVGDAWERITGLEVYGDYSELHILKEGSFYRMWNEKPMAIAVREMAATKDRRNGMAHCVHGVYLYMGWHNTVNRYYNGLLDRVGPDKAEVGIPTSDRAGHFSDLVGYPGMVIGSIDAGAGGVSSVVAYNSMGWCELYRGTLGERIQALYVQSIPGNAVDRLWISEGNNIIWIPLSVDPINHPNDAYNPYEFSAEGNIITSWYYMGLQEIGKLFNSIRIVAENADATNLVYVSYQVDDETSWTDVSGSINQFSEELDLASTPSIDGKRIRFKFRLTSADGTTSPRILATVIESVTRIPTKYMYHATILLEDNSKTRGGQPYDMTTAITKLNTLTTLQALATPCLSASEIGMLDGKYMWLDGVSPRPVAVNDGMGKKDKYVCNITLIEAA